MLLGIRVQILSITESNIEELRCINMYKNEEKVYLVREMRFTANFFFVKHLLLKLPILFVTS